MGCDIHGWVEVNTGDKWVAVRQLDGDRHYQRFAVLAGVRDRLGESKAKPNGVPDNVSDTAKYDIEQWGMDGHSHSHMPLSEAARIFAETEYNASDYQKKYPECAFFNYEEDDKEKARLVFWFDN